MQTLETATSDVISDGRFGRRDAILFDLGEGQYGFWWGAGNFPWNGITFVGAGRLLDVGNVKYASDGSPTQLTVTLSAIADTDLTPDVLGSIESYTYHLRPVLLYRFYFHPLTGAMTGTAPVIRFRGYIDQILHEDQPGGAYSLKATLYSKTVDYRAAGYLRRGVESQKLLNGGSTDLFFEHAAHAATATAKWGTE